MSLKIVFMGTPEFSLKSLESLINSNYKILSVYSQSPKKKNRGQKIKMSPVHKLAKKFNIKIKTPENLDSQAEYEYFKKLRPDVVIAVAYGKLIPEKILNIPKILFLNVHASLLPKWRGAAPIERSILNQDKETGVSIMKIVSELDAGPYLKQVKIKIKKDSQYGDIYKQLSQVGADALIASLKIIESGKANFVNQDHKESTYAKKIQKEETKIDWSQSASNILAKINAFSPNPGAWFNLKNKRIKIIKADEIEKTGKAGMVIDQNFIIGCSTNSIKILELQKEGKRAMKTEEFLIGNKISIGEKLN